MASTITTTTNGATAANHAAAANVSGRDHVVIFPFMAKGHTLPLLHFATALTAHHKTLRVTVLTTPANRAFAAGRLPPSVSLVELPFPSLLPPLPAGVESTDALPCPSLYPTFLRTTALLREPFAEYLASLPSPPLAVVSDFFLGFTRAAAADAGVRRVVFHGMSCFSMAVCKALIVNNPPDAAAGGGDTPFRVPGMPEHVGITVDEVPDALVKFADAEDPVTRFLVDDVGFSDVLSWGVLVNSFAALDESYVAPLESFYQVPGSRAWLVGPLFLAAAGDTSELEEEEQEHDPDGCLAWLDDAQPGSVVYVSFGTQAHISDAQLDEITHGLVQSGHRFLWAVRSDTWTPPADVGPNNGRIVRGWVPQRRVLAHEAVGGFVSHCGWNSVMESLAAGKPMLAWPMIAEQHLNARHVANILGAGVRIDTKPGGMAAAGEVVGRAEVEEKVRELMDAGGEAGREMRARAAWARREAMSAVSEGGASRVALRELVDELQRTYGESVTSSLTKGKCS
ncbi:unnamed protein product [Urochloa decumbens]|uniref:Glycosyltransferase n=1 Tax=Urochloa decumbens TaxID=240449 RepID=A0ABC9E7L2_9POAL